MIEFGSQEAQEILDKDKATNETDTVNDSFEVILDIVENKPSHVTGEQLADFVYNLWLEKDENWMKDFLKHLACEIEADFEKVADGIVDGLKEE